MRMEEIISKLNGAGYSNAKFNVQVPLHLDPNDTSREAAQKRFDLHSSMMALTGGKGFRQPGNNSKPTRMTRLAAVAYGL